MQEKIKKSYKKPTITKVELAPKEAVLAGCKTQTSGGWGFDPPRCTTRTGVQCEFAGS